MKKFDRRSFLKASSLSAAAIASTSLLANCVSPKTTSKGIYMGGFAAPKIPNLRAAQHNSTDGCIPIRTLGRK